MLSTCGSYEPFNSPQLAFFSCLIAQYFWSFFFDHPVFNDLYAFLLINLLRLRLLSLNISAVFIDFFLRSSGLNFPPNIHDLVELMESSGHFHFITHRVNAFFANIKYLSYPTMRLGKYISSLQG